MAITYVGGDVGTTAGSTLSITNLEWPTVQAGDVALLWWTLQSTMTPTDPGGFDLRESYDGDSGSIRSRFYSRVCTGSESGGITLAASGANRMSAVLVIYRGCDTTTPVDTWARADTGTATTSHACPQVTTGAANCVIITAAAERSTTGTADWTAPSGYTERQDTVSGATGSGGTITAVADDGLASGRSSGTAVTPPNWTGTLSTGNVTTWTVSLRPATGQTVNLGRATATTTAQPLTLSKAATAGRASETSTAQPLTATKAVALSRAVDAATAHPLTTSKSLTIGRTSETASAQPITLSKATTLGRASQADTAQPVAASKALALGRASETTTAHALGIETIGGTVVNLGRAVDTTTARQLTISKTLALGQAAETGTAQQLAVSKTVTLSRATTTSTAGTLTLSKVALLGRAAEQTTARALAVSGGAAPPSLPANLGGSLIPQGYSGSAVSQGYSGSLT